MWKRYMAEIFWGVGQELGGVIAEKGLYVVITKRRD